MTKSKKLTFFYLLLSVTLINGICYAAPSISTAPSQIDNNSAITLSGQNFGQKSHSAPLLWDNFESGSNGSVPISPVIGPNWISSHSGSPVTYSNSVVRSGTMSAKSDFIASGNYRSSLGLSGGPWGSLYVSLWYRSDYGNLTAYNGSPSRNQKIFRIEGNNGTKTGSQGEGVPLVAYEKLHENNFFTSSRAQYSPTLIGSNAYHNALGWENQKWNRIEMYMNVIDGQKDLIIWENAQHKGPSKTGTWWTNTWQPAMGGDNSRFNRLYFGFYFSRDNGALANVYFDDVYVDTTRARVEIGNASTFAASTHREIQIPSAWSNNSITVTVNRGTFPVGAQAYLFVVDANGVPSPGYPITIGSDEGTLDPPPAAPSGLEIIITQ